MVYVEISKLIYLTPTKSPTKCSLDWSVLSPWHDNTECCRFLEILKYSKLLD